VGYFSDFHQETRDGLLQTLDAQLQAELAVLEVLAFLAGRRQGGVLEVHLLVDLPARGQLLDAEHRVRQVLAELVLLLLLQHDGRAQLGVQLTEPLHARGLRDVPLDHVPHL
jgi:hypothetical protein